MKPNLKSPVLFPAVVVALLLWAATQAAVAGGYEVADLGVYNGEAAGLNNSGQIVGWTFNTYWSEDFAVYWTNSSSPPVDLTPAVADYYSAALAINNSGQIVGGQQLGESQGFAYEVAFWNNSGSTAVYLATLGGDWAGATGINASGQIAGYAYTAAEKIHAAFWYNGQPINAPVDLGTLGQPDPRNATNL